MFVDVLSYVVIAFGCCLWYVICTPLRGAEGGTFRWGGVLVADKKIFSEMDAAEAAVDQAVARLEAAERELRQARSNERLARGRRARLAVEHQARTGGA